MTDRILKAHAKINLYLRVLGRRPDGYHDIDSLIQTISLHDSLELTAAEELRLVVDPPTLPADAGNLVWKAAAALFGETDANPAAARIVLRKAIPVGAGLGGGSSDAAAALAGLDRLSGRSLGEARLRVLAERLGSDVPLFLTGGTALIGGRGTEITPLPDLPGRPLVVSWPGVSISTAEVYAQVRESLTPRGKTDKIPRFGKTTPGGWEDCVRLGNDLESIASGLCPAIREIRERLLSAGASAAAMTGSGSAVFGVFDTQERSSRAASELERRGWRAWVCASVGRQAHRSAVGLS